MAAPMQKPQELIAAGISRVSLEIQTDNYSLETQNYKFKALGEKFGCQIPEQ